VVWEGRGRLKNRILGFQTTFLFEFLKDGLGGSFFVGKAHTTVGLWVGCVID
jgi:hypothetical protein